MIKSIYFDVDGVLVIGQFFTELYRDDFGIEIDMSFFKNEWVPVVLGQKDLLDVLDKKKDEWGWKDSSEELLRYWIEGEDNPNMDLVRFAQTLRDQDVKCYVVTNQERHRAKYIRETMEFGTFFDDIFASSELGLKKPNLDFFERILDLTNNKPEEVLFIDDQPKNVEAAKSLGMHSFVHESNDDTIARIKELMKE